jgi:hypothetical protein
VRRRCRALEGGGEGRGVKVAAPAKTPPCTLWDIVAHPQWEQHEGQGHMHRKAM